MPRRQKIANIEESTRHVHHPSPSQQQKKNSNHRNDTTTLQRQDNSTNYTAASKAHGKCIRLRSPLMVYIPTVNVHQVQTATSSNNHQQPSTRSSERIRCSSPYTIASPSTHTQHTSLCTTQTKVMGNHRTSCILKK